MNDDLLRNTLLDLYEEAPCAYVFTRPDGTFARVNGTFLDWTGYGRDELLGAKTLQDLLTVPGKIFYENQYAPLLRMQGFVREVALDIVCKEHERLPVLVNSVQKTDDEGQPVVIASTLFLAADRRAYEQELLRARHEAEKQAAIVTMSVDAIAQCSPSGTVETWNPGAHRMFGYGEEQAQGMRLQELFPSIGSEQWLGVLRSLHAGEGMQLEAVGRRADGEPIDVSVGLAPHIGPMGDLTAVSAIIRDISERKALERLQHEFLAMVSHELGTPLTAIRGHAQLMRRRGRYDQEALDVIVSASGQLGRLIQDLLLASRLEAGRIELQRANVDLVAGVKAAVSQIAGANGRIIHVDAPEEPIMVWADRLRLGQVFTNLLTNALKYSPEISTVSVRVSRSSSEARVSVIDHGVGIPAADLPRVFTRFYRVSATADEIEGLGLGLYIADQIVRGHGGKMTVNSDPGNGSTFTLSIPLAGCSTSVSQTAGKPSIPRAEEVDESIG